MRRIEVNGRAYRLPEQPAVVVCVDGCEPDYITQAVAGGHMPWMKRVLAQGSSVIADCVVPSFTNPNNLSIVTGAPPAVHGICGNYLYDTDSGVEVMMNDPKWLRAPTLLAALAGRQRTARWPSSRPRTSCARCSGHKLQGHLLFRGKSRQSQSWRAWHRGTSSSLVGKPLPQRLQRRSVRVRVCRRRQDHAEEPSRAGHVSVDHRLRPAQACAWHRSQANRLLPHDGPTTWATARCGSVV